MLEDFIMGGRNIFSTNNLSNDEEQRMHLENLRIQMDIQAKVSASLMITCKMLGKWHSKVFKNQLYRGWLQVMILW